MAVYAVQRGSESRARDRAHPPHHGGLGRAHGRLRSLWAWRTACTGSDLATVLNAAAGPTESVPSVVDPAIGYCALFGAGQVAM